MLTSSIGKNPLKNMPPTDLVLPSGAATVGAASGASTESSSRAAQKVSEDGVYKIHTGVLRQGIGEKDMYKLTRFPNLHTWYTSTERHT